MGRVKREGVFVCGGGHQGLSMAAHLALNGSEVTLWNRTESNIEKVIREKTIECSGIVRGIASIEAATSDFDEAVRNVVMAATPSTAHKSIAKRLAPHVNRDMVVILNPGRTFGAIEFAEELRRAGVGELPHIAEAQTIVYTCRRDSGNGVVIHALKEGVEIASIGQGDIEEILDAIPECIRGHFKPVDSTGITSFGNVGMVLHCAPVLMNIGWIESEDVEFKYYYDGISPSIARFIEKLDEERCAVARSFGCEVESTAEWMNRTYGIRGTSILDCIQKNEAYREIDAPGSLRCRYISEDVPNGLVPVASAGKLTGVKTPCIDLIVDLASRVMDVDYRSTGRHCTKDIAKRYFGI